MTESNQPEEQPTEEQKDEPETAEKINESVHTQETVEKDPNTPQQ